MHDMTLLVIVCRELAWLLGSNWVMYFDQFLLIECIGHGSVPFTVCMLMMFEDCGKLTMHISSLYLACFFEATYHFLLVVLWLG